MSMLIRASGKASSRSSRLGIGWLPADPGGRDLAPRQLGDGARPVGHAVEMLVMEGH
jgi:hypothetical protein